MTAFFLSRSVQQKCHILYVVRASLRKSKAELFSATKELSNVSDMPSKQQRPPIQSIETSAEFERWYWLKEELVGYCREHRLGTSGQKTELTVRISRYLDTGEVAKPPRKKTRSSFDWSRSKLTSTTVITDNYRNSRNVRAFMKENAGSHFSFSNEFMEWMRNNVGKTLADAILFWIELDNKKRHFGYREKSLPQNQFNQFTRALSQAVPGITNKEIRRLWAIKRSKPGPHVFQPGDEKH